MPSQGLLISKAQKEKKIVVYFEGRQDVSHLLPVVKQLNNLGAQPILVSSEKLEIDEEVLFIGSGFFRILFFTMLDCKLILMTMPDLERLHIKRSKNPVKYAYLFHSLSSSHTIYHEEAFDAYDIIYSAGPHHQEEIKKEKRYLTYQKRGSARRLPKDRFFIKKEDDQESKRESITIAPTWGEGSLIEHEKGLNIVEEVLSIGIKTFIRIHPMTSRHKPKIIKDLEALAEEYSNFFIELDMANKKNLEDSFVMISDWSGAAFEFSMTQSRPVIFIDTPQKINNLNWTKLELPAAEYEVRKKFGVIVEPGDFPELKKQIKEIYDQQESWSERVKVRSADVIYNLGNSVEIIASDLQKRLEDR